jgi:hypothetical protein
MRESLKPKFDDALYALFTRNWSKARIKAYPRALELQAKNTHGRTVEAFQMIDAKAAGMLTHVSMMIAGLGITAPLLAQHPFEEAVIVAEICVYLLIAVGCLRCLSALAPDDIQGDPASSVDRELIIRQELYGFCNRLAIRFTILVFFSLPIMLWWDPSKVP